MTKARTVTWLEWRVLSQVAEGWEAPVTNRGSRYATLYRLKKGRSVVAKGDGGRSKTWCLSAKGKRELLEGDTLYGHREA